LKIVEFQLRRLPKDRVPVRLLDVWEPKLIVCIRTAIGISFTSAHRQRVEVIGLFKCHVRVAPGSGTVNKFAFGPETGWIRAQIM
jgi:hypothetical protein